MPLERRCCRREAWVPAVRQGGRQKNGSEVSCLKDFLMEGEER